MPPAMTCRSASSSEAVITGARGTYKGARGSMELKVLPDGSGYDFIFHILT